MPHPSKHDELEKLRAEHLKASNYAAEMLRKFGANSPQFGEADRVAAEISAQIENLEKGAGGR